MGFRQYLWEICNSIFENKKRIVAGMEVVANAWPWQVSLQVSGESLKQNTSATLLLSNYLDNIYLQYKSYGS